MEENMLLELNATMNINEMLSDSDSSYVPYNERIETYIVPAVFMVIFIVGVLGNGTLVIIFFRHRAMRNIPNTYILSLALADLLVIIICVPTSVVPYVVESWPWGDTICRITECAKDISIGVSVFTLTALSGERYCAIVNPLRKLQTRPLTVLTASMIWLLAILFAIPPAVVSQTLPVVLDGMNMTIRVCSPYGKYPTFSSYAKYTVVAKALIYYVLPLSIIGALYILMANRLHISARDMPGEALGMQSRAQARARRHVARMVVAFVVVFFVCFFPSHLFALWFQLYPKSLDEYNEFWHTTRIVGFCTSFLNSCANPVALYCVSGVFRQHFNRYLCCFCYKPTQRNRQHSTTGAPDTSIMSTRRSTTCNRSSLHINNNSSTYHNYPNDFHRQQSFQMQNSVINSNGGSSPTQSIILSDKSYSFERI